MATDITATRPISRRPEFADILRDDRSFATGSGDDVGERINGWFDRLLLQSGLEIAPVVLLLLSVLCALVGGGAAFVIQENLLSTALFAAIGGCVPIAATLFARSRRQKEIMQQLPAMIDELARAARTGRSLEQCFRLVAEDTPAPLGRELQICARRLQMGDRMESALRDLPQRTGITSLEVLTTALAVHQELGGDLVRVLDRLAHTVRDRLSFLGRLRAATAASRATAILMLVLPPAIVAFFLVRDAEYFDELMQATWGRRLTGLAVCLQVIGSVWVLRVLRNSRRS